MREKDKDIDVYEIAMEIRENQKWKDKTDICPACGKPFGRGKQFKADDNGEWSKNGTVIHKRCIKEWKKGKRLIQVLWWTGDVSKEVLTDSESLDLVLSGKCFGVSHDLTDDFFFFFEELERLKKFKTIDQLSREANMNEREKDEDSE